MSAGALANIMLELQEKGCHNIEAVTPTAQASQLVEALCLARIGGLRLPLVYNCGGYERPEIINLLDEIVDIWLPDFKYGRDKDALMLSGVGDYVKNALGSIREMSRQAGGMLQDSESIAHRGIIVRHLVLPGMTENSLRVLELLKNNIPLSAPLSLMSQYTPNPSVATHPLLSRRLKHSEYETVVNAAMHLGFETIFTQDIGRA